MVRVSSADELDVYEEVGRGAFGVVYRGVIKRTKENVAIKQIDLELEDINDAHKEISILSECKLPQITGYYGCFVKNFKLWVIMEFVNGGSLFELLKPSPFIEDHIAIVCREILYALEYLHDQGKIHRDLKSQNILLTSTGEVKLTDFGVSTQLSNNFSRRNTTVGTPYWMAPEVILNNNGGHSYKADIWSIGCVAYELAHGKPPLQDTYGPMEALRVIPYCEDFIELVNLDNMDISDNFKDFLSKCLLKDPISRYSASRLLKHKFIRGANKTTYLKNLIFRKQQWDNEQGIQKDMRLYIPTEIKHSEKDKVSFDITIRQTSMDDKEVNEMGDRIATIVLPEDVQRKRSLETSLASQSSSSSLPVTGSDTNSQTSKISSVNTIYSEEGQNEKSRDAINKGAINYQRDLNKVLNKAFDKIDHKNNLSTLQYDSFVELNNLVMRLYSINNDNNSFNKKVLVFQYLKSLIREINKTETLRKTVIPKELATEPADPKGSRVNSNTSSTTSPPDEIEQRLFNNWFNDVISRWES